MFLTDEETEADRGRNSPKVIQYEMMQIKQGSWQMEQNAVIQRISKNLSLTYPPPRPSTNNVAGIGIIHFKMSLVCTAKPTRCTAPYNGAKSID